jgi:DNA-binding CsgD family transcriptional regulator
MRQEEARHLINREVAQMTPLQREILDALLLGDDSESDEAIAGRHGVSTGAIRTERSQIHRRLTAALLNPAR